MRSPRVLVGFLSAGAAALIGCSGEIAAPVRSSSHPAFDVAPAAGGPKAPQPKALRFDGVDDFVDLGPGPSFSTHTIEAWVMLPSDEPVGDNRNIVGPNGAAANGCYTGMSLNLAGGLGGQRFTYVVGRAGCGNDAVIVTDPVTTDEWHHLAGTWDGSSMKFYLDGNLVGTQSVFAFNAFDRMLIGAYWVHQGGDHAEGFFPGDVNEIRLWNHALTQAEIRGRACLTLTGSESGLIGYWRLSEGSGQTVADGSPSGNNGRLGANADAGGDPADPTWVSADVHPCLASNDVTPPVLTLPGNITANATSPAGTPVYFTVSATDDIDPRPAVNCTPSSGSLFPIGTAAVQCVARDASGNSSNGSFRVTVKDAAAQLDELIALIRSFGLPQGTETSLLAKAQGARDAVNGANTGSACGMLGALVNDASAQSGKKLTTAQADQLTAAANRIKAVLGC